MKNKNESGIQNQLSKAILAVYTDAVIKKIDKDNFLDIHLPSVNGKRGTHLFFNTAKNEIKFGFYCRDEEFVDSVLALGSDLERYAQGIRKMGNPAFQEVADAVSAALDFLAGFPVIDSEEKPAEEEEAEIFEASDTAESDDEDEAEMEVVDDESDDADQDADEETDDSDNEDDDADDVSSDDDAEDADDSEETDGEGQEQELDELNIEFEDVALVRYDFIDKSGARVFNEDFEDAEDFINGWARVKLAGVWKYMNKDGGFLKLDSDVFAEGFAEGKFLLKRIDGYFGFADLNGKMITDFRYTDAETFQLGFAKVESNGKVGYINPDGLEIIPCIYASGSSFELECAVVGSEDESFVLNTKGEVIWKLDPDQWSCEFKCGLACVLRDGKYGYIDSLGRMVIPPSFEESADFSEDIAAVTLDGEKIIIDKTGAILARTTYREISDCSNGLLKVVNEKDKYGFIDREGKLRIKCMYDEAESFCDGYAKVELKSKSLILDTAGRIVLKESFDELDGVSEGLFALCKDYEYFFVDSNGERLNDQRYEEVGRFMNGLAKVKLDESWGMIDKSGKMIIPNIYESIGGFVDGLARVGRQVTAQREKFNGQVVSNIAPPSHYNDFDKLKSIITIDYKQIRFADPAILANHGLLRTLLEVNAKIYACLPVGIRSDLAITRCAMENGFFHPTIVDKITFQDEVHLNKIVSGHPQYYILLPEELKSRARSITALMAHGEAITFDHLPQALREDAGFFREILDRLTDLDMDTSHLSSTILDSYEDQFKSDKEVLIKYGLLSWSSESLKADRSFLFEFLQHHKVYFDEMLEMNPALVDDLEFNKSAVSLWGTNYFSLKDDFKKERAFLELALNGDSSDVHLDINDIPDQLLYVDKERLKPDVELIVRILEHTPNNITRIPGSFLMNEELAAKISFALRSRNNILYYATDRLREDKAFVSTIISDNPIAVIFAHQSILGDRAFMLPIVKRVPALLKFCAAELKADKTFVLEALKVNGLVIKHLDESLMKDPDLYMPALEQNVRSWNFLPDEIKHKDQVLDYVAGVQGMLLNDLDESNISKAQRLTARLNSPVNTFESDLDLYKAFSDGVSEEELLLCLQADTSQVAFLSEEFLSSDVDRLNRILEITPYPLQLKACRQLIGQESTRKYLLRHSWFFRFLEEEDKQDVEWVKRMLAINGQLIRYCSESQKVDREFFVPAVLNDPEALALLPADIDWSIDENMKLASHLISIDPTLIRHFIAWDDYALNKLFFLAFALDASVLKLMEQPEDTPWFFVSERYGSHEMDNDDLSYGFNQESEYFRFSPVDSSVKNVKIAIERGFQFEDWNDLFEKMGHDSGIIQAAFHRFPCNETYEAYKKDKGSDFDDTTQVTPAIIAAFPELYPLLSKQARQKEDFMFAFVSSGNSAEMTERLESLPASMKSSKSFLDRFASIEVDYETLSGFFDKKLLKEETFLLKYLILNSGQYDQLPSDLRSSRALALQYAVHTDTSDELLIPENLRKDRDFILEVAQRNPHRDFSLGEDILADVDLLKQLIVHLPSLVRYISSDLLSADFVIELLKINPKTFDHFDEEVIFQSEVFHHVLRACPERFAQYESGFDFTDLLAGLPDKSVLLQVINNMRDDSIREKIEAVMAGNLVKMVIPGESGKSNGIGTLFYVNGPCTFTLGYDRNIYLSEDVAGVLSDEMVNNFLESSESWSDHLWSNSWYDKDSIYHTNGMVEPATDLQLPNGKFMPIQLRYKVSDYNKLTDAFNSSSKGDFVHISSSDEKGYGWNSWYQYSLEVVAGIFDIRKIEVQFDSEVVSGYTYEDQNFEQVGDYTTTGQGFSTTLYFNNGSSLEEVDVDELRSAFEAEEGSDLADRARQFLLARNRLE